MYLVKDVHLAIDGGAFIGMWTKPLSYLFKKVIAFEPNPEAFACLEKNCGHLPNVELINKALGEECKTVDLVVGNPGPSVCIQSDTTPPQKQNKKTLAVEMVTLDTLATSPGFIKLDLEGYEYRALTAARATLERSHPVIVVEHSGHAMRYAGSLMYEKFFGPMGYKMIKDGEDQVWQWQ
jgi:FkbM family methyltransferase